jgi:hypothetical protein
MLRAVKVAVLVAVLAASGVAGWSGRASAQGSESVSRAAARKLGYEGVEAYQAGKYALASEKLEAAYASLRAPSLGVWSARALVKRNRLLDAADRYVEVARLPLGSGDVEIQRKAQAEAQTELEALQRSTPTLRIVIEGSKSPSLVVTVDGVPLAPELLGEATPIDPGRHVVEAKQDGLVTRRELSLELSEHEQLTLALTSGTPSAKPAPIAVVGGQPESDQPPAPTSMRRVAAWAVLGVGAAGVVVGGVTGAIAMSKRSALDEDPACADRLCPPSHTDQVNSLNAMRNVSTVAFIAGGALAATGLVLVLTAPRASTSTAIWISPTSAGLSRTF